MNKMSKLIAFLCLCSLIVSTQSLNIGLIHSEDADYSVIDVATVLSLQKAGFNISSVDIQYATSVDLSPYDAVIFWTVIALSYPVAIGNIFADYVTKGGGVVVMVFGTCTYFGSHLSGNFYNSTSSMYAITPGAEVYGSVQTLKAVQPNHPILQGVTKFNGGPSSYRTQSSVASDAQLIATWSDGLPLIATKMVGSTRRVDMSFYPASSATGSDGWDSTTDGGLLMANALKWVVAGACSAQSTCSDCATNGCQWCLDTNTCEANNQACKNRIVHPDDCPAPACNQLSVCSTCTNTKLNGACTWCLDTHTCVTPKAMCQGEITNSTYCKSP